MEIFSLRFRILVKIEEIEGLTICVDNWRSQYRLWQMCFTTKM